MPKYFSLMLSPNISKTVHGYLICENVPLCRSGFQEYLGRELVGFPGYEESWGLEPETRYKVFRPKESVLDPEFIKSIDGNTVVDEHPDGSVVHVENDGELNCGHVENVGKGEEIDGEVTLKGDLHIKNPELIEKVRPEADPNADYAVRDVSLGYSLRLKRLEDGTIIMFHLRGNHVAVVEKGRAGPMIAIKDSAEELIKAEQVVEPPKKEFKSWKELNMPFKDLIMSLGFKQFATDAKPEDLLEAAQELGKKDEPAEHKDPEPHADASHHSLVSDYLAKGGCPDALASFLKGETKPAGDAEEPEELKDEDKDEDKKDDKDEEHEEHQEEDTEKPGDAGEMSNDADEIDDAGESVLKAANDADIAVRANLKVQKKLVAVAMSKSKDKRSDIEQTMIDSYTGAVKALNSSGGHAYKKLAKVAAQPGIATDSVTKTETVCTCFEGVPYAKGLKRHQESCLKETK